MQIAAQTDLKLEMQEMNSAVQIQVQKGAVQKQTTQTAMQTQPVMQI